MLRVKELESQVEMTVGEFLMLRLHQLGIYEMFGVPGDFNLGFLDVIEDCPEMEFVGCCNELNAAYAADGYARVLGMGSLVTTYGVGELSAINGHAGAYAEHIKLVHIVGTPTAKQKEKPGMIHHSIAQGEYDKYFDMFRLVSCDAAILEPKSAACVIDRVLTNCWLESRPVYMCLPGDVCTAKIKVDPAPLEFHRPVEMESHALEEVIQAIQQANRPVIVADGMLHHYSCAREARAFVENSGLPVVTTPLGKSVVDETCRQFQGMYMGKISPHQETVQLMRESDCIVWLGKITAEVNMGGYTGVHDPSKVIRVNPCSVEIGTHTHKIEIKSFIAKLARIPKQSFQLECDLNPSVPECDLTQQLFWSQMDQLVKPNDIVIADLGTSAFGSLNIKLKHGSLYISQLNYSSIGYTIGATLGATLALKRTHHQRIILFIGDGSFQVACQDLANILNRQPNFLMFLLNNNGYTIERVIQEPDRSYHDINQWRYQNTFDYFCPKAPSKPFSLRSKKDLTRFLATPLPPTPTFVEVHFGEVDAPEILKNQIELVNQSKLI